jgi:hypothetical protein
MIEAAGATPAGSLRWYHASTVLWLDPDRARILHQDNLPDALAMGDIVSAAAALADLGTIELLSGNSQKAAEQVCASLLLTRDIGDVPVTELCLEVLAAVAALRKRPELVAWLLGLAERICARGALAVPGAGPASELRRPLPDGLHLADLIAYARAELGPDAFDTNTRTGSRLSLEKVLAEFAPAG